MFIKIALAAVIVVSAAAMASAATRSHKTAVYRSDPRAQATVPRTPRFSNPTVRRPQAVAASATIKTSTTGDAAYRRLGIDVGRILKREKR